MVAIYYNLVKTKALVLYSFSNNKDYMHGELDVLSQLSVWSE